MRIGVVLLAALLLAILAPSASACLVQSGQGAAVAPLLDMKFPDKQKCKAPDLSDCAAVPGEPFEMDGILEWSWALDQCEAGTVAISPADIVITFPPFPRNPSWLKLTMTPSEIRIPFDQQNDITDDDIDPMTQKVIIKEEFPIHVKIERVGEPTDEEWAKLEQKLGVAEMYAKAVSAETPGYQPGFAFENFRFDATSLFGEDGVSGNSDSNDAPAPSFAFLAVGLVGLAVALRRRA